MAEKYFWLKLDKDFFKRHDIKIIEAMPNGKDYILFYLKLLCESISHEGNLRFNDNIPYNEEMLATITNTNIDIVRSAINVFTKLKMMEILDDGTIYMIAVNKMLGSECGSAERVRRFREKQKMLQCNNDVTNCNIEIEIEKEKDIDTLKAKKFVPPSIEEITQYCQERNNGISPQVFYDFYESKNWMIGKNKMKDWKAAIRTWENQRKGLTNSSNKKLVQTPDWYENYKKELSEKNIPKSQDELDVIEAAKGLFGDDDE